MSEKFPLRTVTVNQAVYIRRDDVCSLIRDFAGCEETDVRNRLESLAESLDTLKARATQQHSSND